MRFLYYDIIFLVLFGLFLIAFLYKRRKNLKREWIMYLYRTKLGIRFINCVGKKYRKILKVMSYLVVIVGYVLMVVMVYLLGQLIYVFIKFPEVVKAVKIPPLMPLIPYLPSIFKIEFLPPFYFTYWIIAIAIIAISHEFSHGIFAKLHKIKIKSTGFGFLGPFLAAFVEPDEKQMNKKSKFSQITVLSAGSFANVIMTIIFFIVLYLFFILTFAQAGALFNTYAYSNVNIDKISAINGYEIENPTNSSILNLLENEEIKTDLTVDINGEDINLTEVEADGKFYFSDIESLKSQIKIKKEIFIYEDTPAIRAGIKGAITNFNNVRIKNNEDLARELAKYKPQDDVKIKTKFNETILSYELRLAESPNNKDKAYLGIGTIKMQKSGVMGFLYNIFTLFKEPSTYYEPRFNNNLIIFIYNLIWWVIIINISVALVNMLPVGIFDGGRVFYLTAWAITKKEKTAKRLFKIITLLILLSFLLLMLFWFVSYI